jgi:anti-sigma-K factor RskA
MSETKRSNPPHLVPVADQSDESERAVQRLQELQLMVARGREELRDLEAELHRQQGRVEVLLSRPAPGQVQPG